VYPLLDLARRLPNPFEYRNHEVLVCGYWKMNEPVTTEETTRRWRLLVGVHDLSLTLSSPSASATLDPEKPDPFDCSSLVVKSKQSLVDQTLEENLIRWQQLDDRKVKQQVRFANNDNSVDVQTNGSSTYDVRGGWLYKDDKLHLPDGFDYATVRTVPPNDDDDHNKNGDRVLCLDAPLTASGVPKTESYHTELWKLFASIPSFDDLVNLHHSNHLLHHTASISQHMDERTRSEKVQHEGYSSESNIALSMLRLSDRHGYPPPTTQQQEYSLALNSVSTVTTVWLECWKCGMMPPSSSSTDENRMLLEFWDGQTLLDVHKTICQMIEDNQWDLAVEKTASRSGSTGADVDMVGEGVDVTNTTTLKNGKDESGCFFIENTCFKTGRTEYCESILNWMWGGKSSTGNTARLGYFGISTSDGITIQDMKDVKLSQIPFQLGIRYYHCCHGNVETSIMLVDRQWTQIARKYPIIHDIWLPSQRKVVPTCEACQTNKVFYVTGGQCQATDGGPKMICEKCCLDMKILEREPSQVAVFSTWMGLG
jgi:snRNA-activating protein complex (SNAPc), subunit 3